MSKYVCRVKGCGRVGWECDHNPCSKCKKSGHFSYHCPTLTTSTQPIVPSTTPVKRQRSTSPTPEGRPVPSSFPQPHPDCLCCLALRIHLTRSGPIDDYHDPM